MSKSSGKSNSSGSFKLWRTAGEIANDFGRGAVEFSEEMDKLGSLIAWDMGRRATGQLHRAVEAVDGYFESQVKKGLNRYRRR